MDKQKVHEPFNSYNLVNGNRYITLHICEVIRSCSFYYRYCPQF